MPGYWITQVWWSPPSKKTSQNGMVRQFGLSALRAAGFRIFTCFDSGEPTSHIVKVRGVKTTKKLKAGAHVHVCDSFRAPILVVRS
jgi:hypothetical protein